MQPELTETPLPARIRLSHAYFQNLANINHIDILHVKGYAFGTETYYAHRNSTDVDILVRPAHVNRLMYLLSQDGWKILTHFKTGSIFEHASTLYHPAWGLADIHQYFPGIGYSDPSVTFDRIWDRRRAKQVAHFSCVLPSIADSRLFVIVHSARSTAKPHPDISHLQETLSTKEWDELRVRARELESEIAFDTALGELSRHRDDPTYFMWLAISEDVPFYVEWYARLKQASSFSEKIKLLWQIATINEDHLAMSLGHSPSQEEKRHEFFTRFRRVLR